MKINIYYGGRGLLDDPTLYVLDKMEGLFDKIDELKEKFGVTGAIAVAGAAAPGAAAAAGSAAAGSAAAGSAASAAAGAGAGAAKGKGLLALLKKLFIRK